MADDDQGYVTDPDVLERFQASQQPQAPQEAYVTDPDVLARFQASQQPQTQPQAPQPQAQPDEGYVTDPNVLMRFQAAQRQAQQQPAPAVAQPSPPPQAESELVSGLRHAAHEVIPTTAGVLAGLGAGALTAPLSPFVSIPAGIATGAAVQAAVKSAQEKALDYFNVSDAHQMALDEAVNPKSSFTGELAPQLLTMGTGAVRPAARLLGAGLGGAFEAGREYLSGEDPSLAKIGIATGFGGVAAAPRAWTERIIPHGLPGPHSAAGVSEAAAKPVVGKVDDQNISTGSERQYAKGETAADQAAAPAATVGEPDPAKQAALAAATEMRPRIQEIQEQAQPTAGPTSPVPEARPPEAPPPEPPAGTPPPTGGEPAPPPPPRPGFRGFLDTVHSTLGDIFGDLQTKTVPMATGSPIAQATMKDFASLGRKNEWDWTQRTADLERRFTPDRLQAMWHAADEESVLRQTGQSTEGRGVSQLRPEEQTVLDQLQGFAQKAWERARELGIVTGQGLPYYTPRMIIGLSKKLAETEGTGGFSLDPIGLNLRTSTPQLQRRSYLTAAETEAAAKAKFGPQAEIARDIRTLPLAIRRLEDAVAGREVVNKIAAIGKTTGQDLIHEGHDDPGPGWFKIDHPSLTTYRPKLDKAGQAVLNQDGHTVFEKVPLWIRGDFEGPMRAVLSGQSGAAYKALMDMKGKVTGLVMTSPAIHLGVEYGRAFPSMPGRIITGKVTRDGYRAKNDAATMHEAIDGGLVPIGKRFFNQDIDHIMEHPDLTPGRSWTAKILAAVPGLFDPKAGVAVKRAIDRAGDFWHNTLLWDQVANLQMGLYVNYRNDAMAAGFDRLTASRMAAHMGNRYAGALPREAMSENARKLANLMMFSRSFTLGNMGVLKDAITGLPRDVLAQIERDGGFPKGAIEGGKQLSPADLAKSWARRKAIGIVALDMGLMYAGNSLLQNGMNMLRGSSVEDEIKGYADRFHDALQNIRENPQKMLQPFDFIQRLSATAANEPGHEDRIKVGHTSTGRAIYARNPVGKLGEEFTHVLSPIDMIKRKWSTFARPVWEIMANDKGFGQKIYDPNANLPSQYIANAGKIVAHIMGEQVPLQQLQAAKELITGQAEEPAVAAAQTFGPIAGVTFSKGHPLGEAGGLLATLKERQRDALYAEMPDIRKQIKQGDVAGAQKRMIDLGVPPGLRNYYVRQTLHPSITRRSLQDFYRYATPEQRKQFESLRGTQ